MRERIDGLPDKTIAEVPETALPGAKRERRSNPDRSATTRKQILEATIRCLHDHGYGAVTNIRVADAAGVSRGAMMHHFPTRQALLVATIEYAYTKLATWRANELAKLEPGLPKFRALIDLAWATSRMPEGLAVNEVRIGSRSDPEIAAAVTAMMSHIADDYGRFIGRHVREAGLTPDNELQGFSATVAMTVRSLAIDRITYPNEALVENILGTLKSMRESIIARQLGDKAGEQEAQATKSHLR
jgi:AcrR family transcriptional regulator